MMIGAVAIVMAVVYYAALRALALRVARRERAAGKPPPSPGTRIVVWVGVALIAGIIMCWPGWFDTQSSGWALVLLYVDTVLPVCAALVWREARAMRGPE